MANWSLLGSALSRVEGSIRYSWDELDTLVGGLPASATNHRAWWSGDRTHVNAWRSAGFSVTRLIPGREVTFVRTSVAEPDASAPPVSRFAPPAAGATLLLVTCVKEKLAAPAAAQDLYVSALFKRERAYAERSGLPWFILSAEHGLVAPDEWLAPYERYLPDTPSSYRQAWGGWIAERLELLVGSLVGQTVEVHAGSAYIDAVRAQLTAKGALVLEPLAGLTLGQRLQWYGEHAGSTAAGDLAVPPASVHDATDRCCQQLADEATSCSAGEFIARGSSGLNGPGLYSWWVDHEGATDLSLGLGLPLDQGLIYAGLAGATRWPSGRRSTNTLWARISGMHLGGRHEFSTFRRTLGSILANARGEAAIDEIRLTRWMTEHLRVIAVPFEDADTLGRLEADVLTGLDPPLNLQGMSDTPTRRRIKELRRPHAGRKRRP